MKPRLILDGDGRPLLEGPDGRVLALQDIEPRSQPLLPHVAYLVVDTSSSMESTLAIAIKGAVGFFSDATKKGYYTGLIRFSDDASLIVEPIQDSEAMAHSLSRLTSSGQTNMSAAIRLATHYLQLDNCVKAIILVTDGMPDSDKIEDTLAAARVARSQGIAIIPLGTDNADKAFLDKLASRSDLAVHVPRSQLASAISSAARLLPP